MKPLRCDRTPAWSELTACFEATGRNFDLRDAFARDPRRFEAFSQDAPHVFADLSKNLIDADSQALLLALARQCGLEQQRDAMFAGERINRTEHRAVMHFLLRKPPSAQYVPAQAAINKVADAQAEVEVTLDAMLTYAEQVRADEAITDIVNIGIGGSDLGPQMAVLALGEFATAGKRIHFVSNIDGNELAGVLKQLKPDGTLFLVASKTFTTTETMTNAHSARRWFEAQGGQGIARHFAALTTNVAAANDFGITTTFGFWDWVGGRYSLWSAIGLPIAIAIGAAGFREFLAGAPTFTVSAAAASRRTAAPCAAGRRICSNWKWKATASAWTRTASLCLLTHRRCYGANPAPTASMPTFKCCTRARRWFRSNSWRSGKPRMRPTISPAITPNCWPTHWRRRRR